MRLGLATTVVGATVALALAVSATGAPIARTTTLLSAPTGVADPDTGEARPRGMSADGGRVFFHSNQRLVAGDNDSGRTDVYMRSGGVTSLLSGPTGIADPDSDDALFVGASADGTRVFFQTTQRLTADDNDTGRQDVYERSGGVTTLVSGPTGVADPDTAQADFSGASKDGSRVFFRTTQKLTADDLDTAQPDVYERAGGTTTLISQATGVADPGAAAIFFQGTSDSGDRVFFSSTAKFTADDLDTSREDVYERAGGTTTLVSQPSGLADPNTSDVIFEGNSPDGSHVFFETPQKLTVDDGDSARVDVYQRTGGVTSLISKPFGIADPNSANSGFAGATDDGGRVFFTTTQKLTSADGDTNRNDVYERAGATTILVSEPTGVADPDTGGVSFSRVTADGDRVFFDTQQKMTADDLDTDQQDSYERTGGTTRLVSKPTGVADPDTDHVSFNDISADGSRVFFSTNQKLTPDDTDTGIRDVYERADGTTTLITRTTGVADSGSLEPDFHGASADGRRVVFGTEQRMTADDGDSNRLDVYLAADTSPPDTTITAGPAGATNDSTPSFSFSSNEAGATFECKLDFGGFVPCSSPRVLALADGVHSFQVRARDNADNLDPSPAVRVFTIATTRPARDTAAPLARLSGRRTQKLGRSVAVTVTCQNEACRAAGTASTTNVPVVKSKRFALRRTTRSIRSGGRATLRLRLSAKARRAIRRALRNRRRVSVRVRVTVSDAAGNSRVLRRTVRLKR